VFASLTVRENLEIGAFELKNKTELRRRLEEILDLLPALKKKSKYLAGQLSGGEQQLLAIARGLMIDPKVLLLDEPSLGLAPKMVKEVFAKIKEINLRHRTTIMIVEHNIKSVLEIVGRVYVLDKGQIAAEGAPSEIIESKIFEKVLVG
jgi:branched-chain amino acid transport system ATP-binding protein